MKVLLFHNMIVPYRHALFQALSAHMALDVWYSTTVTRDRHWNTEIPTTYRGRVLKNAVLYAYQRPLIFCPGLCAEMRRHRPDAIVSVFSRSNLLDVIRLTQECERRRIPLVFWVGDVDSEDSGDEVPSFINSALAWCQKRALKHGSGFLFYSDLSRNWATSRGARGPAMVGTQVLPEPPMEPRLSVPPSTEHRPIRALYVGKLESRKGVDLLAAALPEAAASTGQKVQLIVAGDGPMRGIWKSSSNVDVLLLGNVNREALWSHYRASDLLILPTRKDPWGFVTNEAMSVGTPVLTTSTAGSCELAARAGWVAKSGDIVSLTHWLKIAFSECRDPGRRPTAVAAEQLYRPEPCAQRIAELLTDIVKTSHHEIDRKPPRAQRFSEPSSRTERS